jgi:hypothetical protein
MILKNGYKCDNIKAHIIIYNEKPNNRIENHNMHSINNDHSVSIHPNHVLRTNLTNLSI